MIRFCGLFRSRDARMTQTLATNNFANVMPFLIAALALGGCVTQPPAQRDNAELRRTIHDAVPDSWRIAAESAQEISPLAVTPDLREFVLSTSRRNATDRQRMLALTGAILHRDGIGLVYDADATHSASEAFRSGTANCLGFSNLLVASARELGLKANFELVSQRLRWDKVGDVLVGSLHVRVVSLGGVKRMVFDFYPVPVKPGYSTRPL
jgi:transglutaminase-like putative cysteine protease